MTILPHVDNIQDTGYFCGPATLQVLLGIRGVSESEQQAAVEAHTTTDGTPSIDDLVRVLNAHLGAGTYRSVWIGGNGATVEQVAQLRADLGTSIGAGYGVGINVLGTATTADGREVNSYSGGHYIPVTGITDAGLPWLTDVADGHEYAMTWQALGDWIAGKGYATITAAVAAPSTVEGKMYYTIVPGPNGTLWLCDGMFVRHIENEEQLAHIRYIASQGAIQLWHDKDGSDVWKGGLVPAFGVDIATLVGSGTATVDTAAIAKAVNDDAAARLAE